MSNPLLHTVDARNAYAAEPHTPAVDDQWLLQENQADLLAAAQELRHTSNEAIDSANNTLNNSH